MDKIKSLQRIRQSFCSYLGLANFFDSMVSNENDGKSRAIFPIKLIQARANAKQVGRDMPIDDHR